jgi:predicted nucleic-acid-binding Zn-ribbon protein
MKIKISKCTCRNAGQDQLHGTGNRVWNPAKKAWRCTVCGATEIYPFEKKQEAAK